MRIQSFNIFCLCIVLFSTSACSDDRSPTEPTAGEMTAGEMTAGEMTAGEMTAGEMTAGEMTAGEMTAGEMTAGEITAGEITAGEMAAGEMTAGEMTAGEMAAGEMTQEEEMDMLAQRAFEWLSGRFDSSAQSIRQPSYFAIQLLGCEVKAEELGEHVLYIEQAQLSAADEPYRQRLYQVESMIGENGEIEVVSTVYSLTLPDAYIGLCSDENINTFSPSNYIIREGCAVHLKWVEDHFEGGTQGEECLSTLNGATYASSQVYMDAETIRSWDQGFNASNEQVWGATDGAYDFARQE